VQASSPTGSAPQEPYVVPDCGCGEKECFGPDPVPWLPWKHCFRLYEFRTAVVPVGKEGVAKLRLDRLLIRVRYEHALCLLGRKQGPIVHSLTLLPKEEVRIFESDRYRRTTSATQRFSARTSFFTMIQRVNDAYSSTKASAGGSASVSTSVSGGGGGGIDLGIVSFGAEASASTSGTTSTYFDVARVSEQFSHVAETSSLAVESERSIVVSTFEDQESLQSTARTLRNDNACRAVTYFIRRVFEIYELRTRIVGIEVQVGRQWVDLGSTPDELQKVVRKFLAKVDVGAAHDPRVEIALPTDGLLYEAELAHCCSCECEHEAKARLELERLQLENFNLRLEAERRQKRLDAGDLEPFEKLPLAPGEA
jgi:thermitase